MESSSSAVGSGVSLAGANEMRTVSALDSSANWGMIVPDEPFSRSECRWLIT